MFEWLEEEMRSIKTPKFHLVDGPITQEQETFVRESPLEVPSSYKNFVVKFGNTRLYRQGTGYQIQVYAVPVETESRKGEKLIHFGRTDMGLSYFKEDLLLAGEECPVFDWTGSTSSLRRAADGFEDWLNRKCKASRRQYKKTEWAGILQGPKPFTKQEQAIVEAREQFSWRVVGIAKNGDLKFEVNNGSSMILPYLGINIRCKSNGQIIGGVWLPISHIQPGHKAIVNMDCYKDHLHSQDVDPFDKPRPGPEDRDCYWEFKPTQTEKSPPH